MNRFRIMRSLLLVSFICCISSLGSANAATMTGRSCCSPVYLVMGLLLFLRLEMRMRMEGRLKEHFQIDISES